MAAGANFERGAVSSWTRDDETGAWVHTLIRHGSSVGGIRWVPRDMEVYQDKKTGIEHLPVTRKSGNHIGSLRSIEQGKDQMEQAFGVPVPGRRFSAHPTTRDRSNQRFTNVFRRRSDIPEEGRRSSQLRKNHRLE